VPPLLDAAPGLDPGAVWVRGGYGAFPVLAGDRIHPEKARTHVGVASTDEGMTNTHVGVSNTHEGVPSTHVWMSHSQVSGSVTSTMRRAAHPSGCARCGAGAGCLAIQYQSLSPAL